MYSKKRPQGGTCKGNVSWIYELTSLRKRFIGKKIWNYSIHQPGWPFGGPCDLAIHCSDSGVKHLNAMRTTSLSLQRSGCANDKHRQLERMASQHDIVELYWYINLVGPKQQQNTAFSNDFERAQLLRHLTSLFHHFLSTDIWSISNITSKIQKNMSVSLHEFSLSRHRLETNRHHLLDWGYIVFLYQHCFSSKKDSHVRQPAASFMKSQSE